MKKYAVLPCNGLDKSLGPLTREVALRLVARDGDELICPVLLGHAPDRYARALGEMPLLVIDGCATGCATKLANRLELKIARKLQMAEEVKRLGATLEKSLTLDERGIELAGMIAAAFAEEEPQAGDATTDFDSPRDYIEVAYDKFVFKVPATGFFFNENDMWVQPSADGTRARIGCSDFSQQQMTDITFFGPPAIGTEVEQFDEVGVVESSKAILETVCPVSGRVVAVNTALSETPELVNESPYEQGWFAELELRDFSAERQWLLDGPAYAEVIKKKAAEY